MSRKAQTAKELEFENEALKRVINNLKRQISTLRRQLNNEVTIANDVQALFDEEEIVRLVDFQKNNKEVEKKQTEPEELVFVLPNGQERRVKRRVTV